MKRRLALGLVAFLAIAVALVAPMPWLFDPVERAAHRSLLAEHLLERYEAAQLVFLIHVAGGAIALLTGPWQLVRRLRARRPRLHRANGYLYVGSVALGGCAGLWMGPHAWGGPIARVGFSALAIAWLGTTAIGFHRILSGDRGGHRAWMTHSFALAFAAVSLRVQLLLLGVLGVPAAIAYATVAWSCWVPNLVVAQLVIVRRNSAGETPVQRRNARVNELCSENPSR